MSENCSVVKGGVIVKGGPDYEIIFGESGSDISCLERPHILCVDCMEGKEKFILMCLFCFFFYKF